MARYLGLLQGNRGKVSRLGSAKSGIEGDIRGWDIGAKVTISPCHKDPNLDEVFISITRGSNGRGDSLYLGSFIITNNTIRKVK